MTANFPDENFVAVILLYLLISAIVCVPYAIWRQRASGDLSDAGAAGVILDAHNKAVDDVRAGRAAPYYIIPPVDADLPASSRRSSNRGKSTRNDG